MLTHSYFTILLLAQFVLSPIAHAELGTSCPSIVDSPSPSHRYSHLMDFHFSFEGQTDQQMIDELSDYAVAQLPAAYSKVFVSGLKLWKASALGNSFSESENPEKPSQVVDLLKHQDARDFVSTCERMLATIDDSIPKLNEYPMGQKILLDYQSLLKTFIASPKPNYHDYLVLTSLWENLSELPSYIDRIYETSKYSDFKYFNEMISNFFDRLLGRSPDTDVPIYEQKFFSDDRDRYGTPNLHSLNRETLQTFPYFMILPTRRFNSHRSMIPLLALGLQVQQIGFIPVGVHEVKMGSTAISAHDSQHNYQVRKQWRVAPKAPQSSRQILIEMVVRLRINRKYLESDLRASKSEAEINLLDYFWMGLQHEVPHGLDRPFSKETERRLLKPLGLPLDAGDYIKGLDKIPEDQRKKILHQLVEYFGIKGTTQAQ